MKLILPAILLCLSATAFAQRQPLSASIRTSHYRYIYSISPKQALKLYKNIAEADEDYLYSLVDSFPVNNKRPGLKEGNYLEVYALSNRLHYELLSIGDLQMKLVNNKRDLAVALHTKMGGNISDAKVSLKGKKLSYDAKTKTYRLNKSRKSGNLQVIYHNTAFYFPVNAYKRQVRVWETVKRKLVKTFPVKQIKKLIDRIRDEAPAYLSYFYYQVPYEQKFRGYMVFNKPKYKPGDTVKIKAFVMNKKGRGIKNQLFLRLTGDGFVTDTILANLHPYRRGGYTYEFVLSDSLDLDLDEGYLVTLEEQRSRKYDVHNYNGNLDEEVYARKRKIVMRGRFTFEEYELNSIRFTARADKKEHQHGEPVNVFLKATDENDLPVMDGRFELTLLTENHYGVSTTKPALYVPDSLWKTEGVLEAVGETRVSLPDSIFPAANFNYRIQAVMLNSNNERQSANPIYLQHFEKPEGIRFEHTRDSLYIEINEKGLPSYSPATIYVFADRHSDTLQTIITTLPTAIPVNPFVHSYKVVAGAVEKEFELKDKGLVTALASRTRDSVFVVLNNPHKLPVWYTLFAGNKPVMQGKADSFYISTRSVTKKPYTISIQYVFGNQVFTDDYAVAFRNNDLKLELHAPLTIQPGAEASIEIAVTDVNNKPVEGADVTAYSFTKKFESTNMPYLAYLGKTYKFRKAGYVFSEGNETDRELSAALNWKFWSKEMGLDSIEYYKFLYPAEIYRNEEKVKDSITQFAPFVVVNGAVQPVHLLYIDERPVFFSRSQDLRRYSFQVTPGYHNLRIRTKKQEITYNHVLIPAGVKTILSINGDTTNKAVRIAAAPDTLTNDELDLLVKYTILLQNTYGENFSYIKQHDKIFLLPRVPYESGSSMPLIGPLSPFMADLVVHDQFAQSIDPEGGYVFQVRPGFIKQKEVNTRRYIGKGLSGESPFLNFSDLVWTESEIDSLWLDYLDRRSATRDLFVNNNYNIKGAGRLRINIRDELSEKLPVIKNLFLFKYDNTDFIRVYKGEERDLGYLFPGVYRLFVLLKGDSYLRKDSLVVKKDGINFYTIDPKIIDSKDSVSERFAKIIRERAIENIYDTRALDSISLNFNQQFTGVESFTNEISGNVTDVKGNPVPFATVSIRGTRSAVTADAHGLYRIRGPQEGTLVFSAVGYASQEVRITSPVMNIVMMRHTEAALQEVVVTAYGVRRKSQELGYSTSVVTQLSGKVAGLIVRGSNTVSTGNQLIVIDGVLFKGSLSDLDPSMIGMMTKLTPEVSTALYGAEGNAGAIVIVTKQQLEIQKAEAESTGNQNTIRRNFRDDAYWQPRLKTDKDGKVQFKVRFPDDITNWRNFALAVSDKRQTGSAESMTKSFKAISANLALPQFVVVGDSLNFIGKTLNYGNETVQLRRRILIDSNVVKEGSISVKNSVIDTTAMLVPSKDSVQFQFEVIKAGGYFDGEQRTLPVYPQGVTENPGFFAVLEGDSAVVVDLDPALGKITLHAEASMLPVLLEETEKLRRYEYLCNEQLASKLKALLLQKAIDSILHQSFKNEKAVVELISKLMSSAKNNLWGWWPENEAQPWISLHVVEALIKAEKAGYKVGLQKRLITDILVFNMDNYRGIDKLFSLQLLHALDAKLNYADYIDSIEAKMKKPTLYEKLRLMELKQQVGLNPPVDTLMRIAKHTMFGNLYWGEDNYRMFDNSVQNTVLAYRILQNAGEKKTLAKLRNYFLEKRKDGQWRNTYESSLILETILPDLFENGNPVQPASLRFQSPGTEVVTKFPYHAEVSGNQRIAFRKEGGMPLYFTAYQTRWNPKPAAVADAFTVTSYFEKAKDRIAMLKAGEPVSLQVRVDVKGDADYVMIEIPIPAGCSYDGKPQPWSNNEVHREYFKNKVSIFCSSLKQGSYHFSIPLLPRYTGRFQLNPAKAEMMYFPVFFGREGMKTVDIR